jgi:hypothetical protein
MMDSAPKSSQNVLAKAQLHLGTRVRSLELACRSLNIGSTQLQLTFCLAQVFHTINPKLIRTEFRAYAWRHGLGLLYDIEADNISLERDGYIPQTTDEAGLSWRCCDHQRTLPLDSCSPYISVLFLFI